MNQIKSKVYYEILTGNILAITPESQGSVEETTKEMDMTIYPELQRKNINDVDFIELEYGAMATTFNNLKSIKINLESKALECAYYSTEELQAIQTQDQTSQDPSTRIADISNYLLDQSDMISNIEDLIIQTELNKITEGMI